MTLALAVLAGGIVQPWRLLAQAPQAAKGMKFSQVSEADMKEWLGYLSSDELQGRQIYTEGYGVAAQYIADHLKAWGVKPMGDNGSYFQVVKLKGYKVTGNSSVTIDGAGGSKTFKNGEHVTFATNAGKKQTVTFNGVQFLGSAAPAAGTDLKGKLAVWMNSTAPAAAAGAAGGGRAGAAGGGRGGGRGGAAGAALAAGASAAVGFTPAPAPPSAAETALVQAQAALDQATAAVQQATAAVRGRGAAGARAGGAGGRGATTGCQNCDIAPTPYSLDNLVTPQFTGDEAFFEALFSGGPVTFADLKAKADKGEPLTPMAMNVKVTVNIDNAYDVVYEQLSRNVVGMIEGSDPKLKDTYVMYGAHLDHVGYSMTGGGNVGSPTGCRRRSDVAVAALTKAGKTPVRAGGAGGGRGAAPAAPGAAGAAGAGAAGAARGAAGAGAAGAAAGQGAGRGAAPANAVPFDQRDFISNGADDDGSGSTTEMAVAKAFATGPKPKRSIIFVWHSGEEAGLLGSHYMADHPVVPLEKVQAVLNMDMVGRDDCNNMEGDFSNTVFLVGDDRISTDLHNIIIDTNKTMTKPLTLDYEMNDVNDPESVYTRSDHYSYAAKGIPIAFFTTGLHPDYHRVTDTAEKITYPKMARIGQLMYQSGFGIANTDKVLERDNKGPQSGFGTPMEVIKK